MFAAKSYRMKFLLISSLLLMSACSGGGLTSPASSDSSATLDSLDSDISEGLLTSESTTTNGTSEETTTEPINESAYTCIDAAAASTAADAAGDEVLTALNDVTVEASTDTEVAATEATTATTEASTTTTTDTSTTATTDDQVKPEKPSVMPNRFRLQKWRELQAKKQNSEDSTATSDATSNAPTTKPEITGTVTIPGSIGKSGSKSGPAALNFDDLIGINSDDVSSVPSGLKNLLAGIDTKTGATDGSSADTAPDQESSKGAGFTLPNRKGTGVETDSNSTTKDASLKVPPRVLEFGSLLKSLNESVASDLLDKLVLRDVATQANTKSAADTTSEAAADDTAITKSMQKPTGAALDLNIKQLNDLHVRLIGKTDLANENAADAPAAEDIKAELVATLDGLKTNIDSAESAPAETSDLQVAEAKPDFSALKPALETLKIDTKDSQLSIGMLEKKISEVTHTLIGARQEQLKSKQETLTTELTEAEAAGTDATATKAALALVEENLADTEVSTYQAKTAGALFDVVAKRGLKALVPETQPEAAASSFDDTTGDGTETDAATEAAADTTTTKTVTATPVEDTETTGKIAMVAQAVDTLGSALSTRLGAQVESLKAFTTATGGSDATTTATATLTTRQTALKAAQDALKAGAASIAAAKTAMESEDTDELVAATTAATMEADDNKELTTTTAVTMEAEETRELTTATTAAMESEDTDELVAATTATAAAVTATATTADLKIGTKSSTPSLTTIAASTLKAATLSTTKTSTNIATAMKELNITSVTVAKATTSTTLLARTALKTSLIK